ncbi:MAG: T9SS type A sorting domain-containing protein [Bacteroidota bacterium]
MHTSLRIVPRYFYLVILCLALLPIAAWGQCVDPANTSGGTNSGLGDVNNDGNIILRSGQSFQATCNGFLVAIEITVNSISVSPLNGTLRIYSGEPNTGTEQTNQGFSFSTTGLKRIVIGSPVAVTNGSDYAFVFEPALSGGGFAEVQTSAPNAGNYSDGTILTQTVFGGSPNPYSAGNTDYLFTADLETVLPVELTRFDALAEAAGTSLVWETASETGNAGFEIQRRHISTSEWTPIGYVSGAGTTSEPQQYRFVDTDALVGTTAYRLKQIDFDGQFEFSPEVEATRELATTFLLTPAYPNPFNPQTRFTLAVQREQSVRVVLYDLQGQQVAVVHDGVLAGQTTHGFTVEASGLASGAYVLRAEGEWFAASQTLMLLK